MIQRSLSLLFFLLVILISNRVESQVSINIESQKIIKITNSPYGQYDGLYVSLVYEFVNNTQDTITVFDIGYSSVSEPLQEQHRLYNSEKSNYQIFIKATGDLDNKPFEENVRIPTGEPRLLNDSDIDAIPPNSKKIYVIAQGIPSFNSDSIKIQAKVIYNTESLNISTLKRTHSKLNKQFTRQKKKLLKEFETERGISKFSDKCYQSKRSGEQITELCHYVDKYYDLKSEVKTINRQYPLILMLDQLSIESELFEETTPNPYR